jgi:hypothetical protein
MNMAERTLAEMLDDLRLTQQAFLDILSRADEHILYRRPADGGWTLAESLAHIAEAPVFQRGDAPCAGGAGGENGAHGRAPRPAAKHPGSRPRRFGRPSQQAHCQPRGYVENAE